MDEKISIIIPVYKVEAYLRQCLDSVVAQTYTNLEILLIDDGSPDNCGAICDEYAEKDPRVKVTHKQNGGVHAAWNDGLAQATGIWTAFVDPDDWIETDYFASLISTKTGGEVDLIQSGAYYREENNRQYIWRYYLKPFAFQEGRGREFLIVHALLRPKDKATQGALSTIWGKLYRTAFLRAIGVRFDPQIGVGLIGDAIFNIEVYQKVQTFIGTSYCGYHYRVTTGSGSYKFNPTRPEREVYVIQKLESILKQSNLSDNIQKAFESYCLRDIVHNLERCYFHPQNTADSDEIAAGIRKMKQTPYAKIGILSKNNPYNGFGLKVFQIALRLPWVWPLRVIVGAWHMIDRR